MNTTATVLVLIIVALVALLVLFLRWLTWRGLVAWFHRAERWLDKELEDEVKAHNDTGW